MNEKQSSFNSRLDVTTASTTAAATGENDMINECSFNEAIDRDDHEKVQGFIFNTEDEPMHRGVIEQVAEEGWIGWKSFPDDIFSCPEVMNDVVKSTDVTTQELQAISHPYLSNTDGVVVPTLLEDPSSSSSSFTIDSSSSSSRFATTTLRSNSTTVGVRFTGVIVRSSNENSSSGVMQLRLPSKDEIQSIIDASNAPPRSAHGKTQLISIDESETNKMNTSWASGL